MGTYTTNYNLFLPTIGEQGWGDLVNGNFTTIDTTMSGLNARVGTLENGMDAVEDRVTNLEKTIPEEGVGTFNTVEADEIVSGVGKFNSLTVSVTKTNTGFAVGTRTIANISVPSGVINKTTVTLYDDLADITISNRYNYFSMDTSDFVNDVTATFSVSGLDGSGALLWFDVYQNDVVLATIRAGESSQNVTIDLTQPIKLVGRSTAYYSSVTVTLTFPSETYYLS